MKLSILVLHNLGDPLYWRQALVEKELCLPRMAPEHNYIVHDSELPLPDFVKEMQFDAVILTQTFLSKRNDERLYRDIRETYDFIKHLSAFKIALPQDDYTCCDILDRWMVEWKVDLVYTICVNDWDVLYKTYSKSGKLVLGYTGYLSNELIERSARIKPLEERSIDVSYRAASLSPVFGKMGLIKTEIGKRFSEKALGYDLHLDLSTKPSSTIVGSKWLDFMEDSRCMLGVNSGSSLIDPEGLINIAVYSYVQINPGASYEEIEAACFPGQEGKYIFTMVSPRNIECAMLGTIQILTPGPYGGFLQPWEHYLPVEPDMSNLDDIIPVIKNNEQLKVISSSCKKAILSYPELRYDNHVIDLISRISNNTRLSDNERASTADGFKKYKAQQEQYEKSFWKKKRVTLMLRSTLADMGARRVKYLIKHLLQKAGS